MARCIRRTGVQVHFRPTNTLRSKLVHPIDNTDPLEKSGVVYKILCKDCPEKYVGETERKLNAMFKEHHRSSSPVGHHMEYRRHSTDEESISVLTQEADCFRRGVTEAIHIQREAPTLNQGRERHTLPPIYQKLLPATHQHTGSNTDPAVLSDRQWVLTHWLLWFYTSPAVSWLRKTLKRRVESSQDAFTPISKVNV